MTDLRTFLDGLVGLLAIVGTVVLSPLLAPCYRRWGATEEEALRRLRHPRLAHNLRDYLS